MSGGTDLIQPLLGLANSTLVPLALVHLPLAVVVLVRVRRGVRVEVLNDPVQAHPSAPPARLRAVVDQLGAVAVEYHRRQDGPAGLFQE